MFYDDAWRSHWCPYYRINEVEHLLRSRAFRILHLHWKGDEKNRDSEVRREGRALAAEGMIPLLEQTYPDNGAANDAYIPGFEDKCMYPNFSGRPKEEIAEQPPERRDRGATTRTKRSRSNHPNEEIAEQPPERRDRGLFR
jgi:hypothetical protein